jgi:hypothetical protein
MRQLIFDRSNMNRINRIHAISFCDHDNHLLSDRDKLRVWDGKSSLIGNMNRERFETARDQSADVIDAHAEFFDSAKSNVNGQTPSKIVTLESLTREVRLGRMRRPDDLSAALGWGFFAGIWGSGKC